MQEKWDDIDNIIFNSREDIEPSYEYNERLINKLHRVECERKSKINSSGNSVSLLFGIKTNKSAGLSLIMAGLIMLIVVTTGLHYKIIETQCSIRSKIILMEARYDFGLKFMENLFKE